MAEHNRIGHIGEQIAVDLMRKKGYQIIATNHRIGHLEMDIIAANRKEIVFVEVKTRTSTFGGTPEEAVDFAKKKHLAAAANAYIKYNNETRTPRFDVIGILLNNAGETEDIQHYENAFTAPPKYISESTYTGQKRWTHRHR